jgi:hypothetical protein
MAMKLCQQEYDLMDCTGWLYTRPGEYTGMYTLRELTALLRIHNHPGTFAIFHREEFTGKGYFEFFIMEVMSGIILFELGKIDIHTVARWKNNEFTSDKFLGTKVFGKIRALRNIDIEYYHSLFKINERYITNEKEWWNESAE